MKALVKTCIEKILYRARVQFIETLQNFIYKHTIDSKNYTKILKRKETLKYVKLTQTKHQGLSISTLGCVKGGVFWKGESREVEWSIVITQVKMHDA
jgi:hypothetical protein